jgi:SAM-dependent methyltransferase
LLKVKVGLSRKRKVPILYILGGTYLPHQALILLWKRRSFKEVFSNEEHAILEIGGKSLKIPLCIANLMLKEWDMWKMYYIPHFSLKGKTVLDVGAGCGETALLYFLHGASKVIAVEPDASAIKYLMENVRENCWNVEIFPEPFSLKHLKLDFDFMKMDGEGCEELLMSIPEVSKPSVVEVHNNKLLSEFLKKGWIKIHSLTNEVHIVRNF